MNRTPVTGHQKRLLCTETQLIPDQRHVKPVYIKKQYSLIRTLQAMYLYRSMAGTSEPPVGSRIMGQMMYMVDVAPNLRTQYTVHLQCPEGGLSKAA